MLNNCPRIIPGRPINDPLLCKNIESRREFIVLRSEISQFSDFANEILSPLSLSHCELPSIAELVSPQGLSSEFISV